MASREGVAREEGEGEKWGEVEPMEVLEGKRAAAEGSGEMAAAATEASGDKYPELADFSEENPRALR